MPILRVNGHLPEQRVRVDQYQLLTSEYRHPACGVIVTGAGGSMRLERLTDKSPDLGTYRHSARQFDFMATVPSERHWRFPGSAGGAEWAVRLNFSRSGSYQVVIIWPGLVPVLINLGEGAFRSGRGKMRPVVSIPTRLQPEKLPEYP